MPWLDSTKPHVPQFHLEYNQKESSATAWLSKGDPQDTLRGFAIYQSDSPSVSGISPAYRFIPWDPVAGFTLNSTQSENKGPAHFYFVTAISRTNVESEPVPILFLTGR
jgi:hypothetical protein